MRAEFSKRTKLEAWERCKGHCECGCGRKIEQAEYDHYPIPASLNGSNELDNCRVLSKKCHRRITEAKDIPELSKSQRIYEKQAGVRKPKGRPFPKRPKSQQWGRQFND